VGIVDQLTWTYVSLAPNRIKSYHSVSISSVITGRSPENLRSTRISNKNLATKGKRRQKKAKETD
jgi:hypothetical protein